VNIVTISGTIDGVSGYKLYNQNAAVTLQWSGTSWIILSVQPGQWTICHYRIVFTTTIGGTVNNTITASLPVAESAGGSTSAGFITGPVWIATNCNANLCYLQPAASGNFMLGTFYFYVTGSYQCAG
jgi:hypothetical protein